MLYLNFSESLFIVHDDADKKLKSLAVTHISGKLWCQPWQIFEFEDQAWINEALPLQLKLLNDATHTENYFQSETMLVKRMESMSTEQNVDGFNLKGFKQQSFDSQWIYVAETKGIMKGVGEWLPMLSIMMNLCLPSALLKSVSRCSCLRSANDCTRPSSVQL